MVSWDLLGHVVRGNSSEPTPYSSKSCLVSRGYLTKDDDKRWFLHSSFIDVSQWVSDTCAIPAVATDLPRLLRPVFRSSTLVQHCTKAIQISCVCWDKASSYLYERHLVILSETCLMMPVIVSAWVHCTGLLLYVVLCCIYYVYIWAYSLRVLLCSNQS